MKTVGFVFQTAPHGSTVGREGVDAILATAAYCEQIKVFFVADGVTQLLKGQQADAILSRNYSQSFKLFELYDIEDVYCCTQSLDERGLSADMLLVEPDLVTPAAIREQLGQCDQLLVF
uniref:sulfurtransferase complex subunit TusC n=1 Tax=Thaumasiovibrio occultus TaxID=1891184 RepID=UPI000B3647DD|nr:sulfurtransferase complex subunit TusC [Thaumasiovibrio occultus]